MVTTGCYLDLLLMLSLRLLQELLLIEKPLKLVGEKLPNLWNQQARSVVLQSGRSSAALCDARWASQILKFLHPVDALSPGMVCWTG